MTTEMVEVREIIRNMREAGDFPDFDGSPESWKSLLVRKLRDPQVPGIIRAIQEKGFKVPIYLERYTKNHWELVNGHHRLAIAIYLGMDKIPVTNNQSAADGHFDLIQILGEDSQGARIISNSVKSTFDLENFDN